MQVDKIRCARHTAVLWEYSERWNLNDACATHPSPLPLPLPAHTVSAFAIRVRRASLSSAPRTAVPPVALDQHIGRKGQLDHIGRSPYPASQDRD